MTRPSNNTCRALPVENLMLWLLQHYGEQPDATCCDSTTNWCVSLFGWRARITQIAPQRFARGAGQLSPYRIQIMITSISHLSRSVPW